MHTFFGGEYFTRNIIECPLIINYSFHLLKLNVMLDQLMQMIQQQGQQAVVENSQIPDEHNEAIMNEAQQSITNGLQGLADSGDLNQLAQNPQALAGHPAVQNISNNFMQNIMSKFGLSQGVAASVAGALIPSILGKVLGGGGGAGGFDLGGLLSSLGGGGNAGQQGGGGILGNLTNLGSAFGLGKD